MDESEGGPSSTSHDQPPLRRSTRPKKPQIAPIDKCSWRQAQEQGSFCPRSCQGHQGASCTNQLPIWETETWVHLKHTPGLVSNSRPLKAARFIPKGTLFTQFGGHALQKETHLRAYDAFTALRQKINREPGHERLQYVAETEEAYWIPPNDQPLISRASPSSQLKALLTTTPPAAGLGQYANHTCCSKCINAEIAPMVILGENETGEWRDLQGVALRATKDIHAEEEVYISYGEIDTWKKVFTCACCKCSGRCNSQPPSPTAHGTWLHSIKNALNPSPQIKYNDIEANLKRDHVTLYHGTARHGKQPKPSRAAKPQEICIQQASNPRSFSYLTVQEAAPLAPQIKAFLQLPRSASIFLSCRGSLLLEDMTPTSLNRTAEEVITVHQDELQTLWKGTYTACELPLLQAFGTNSMIGGFEINQVLRWALWGDTIKWGLSPHRRPQVHIFCTFAWMHLEIAYKKFEENGDWASFKQNLREIPELRKPAGATTICFPVNIPNVHWYLSVLLIQENAQLLLDSLQSCTRETGHQKAADTIWTWKRAIWDEEDSPDPAPQLKPLTIDRQTHLTTALRTDLSQPPNMPPSKTSAVWESVQQTDGTSCGIFVIARLIALTRGWPIESAISTTLPITLMRAWLMHIAMSLTDRAPLGACARCKKTKILAATHAGATICIRCLNKTPTLDDKRDGNLHAHNAQPLPKLPRTKASTATPPPKPPITPTLPVDEDKKGPRPIHSETRNPQPQKDHSVAARRAWKSPRKKTETKNRSWNKCPDCGGRACACPSTSSEESESEAHEPSGTPTAPGQPLPRAPTLHWSISSADRVDSYSFEDDNDIHSEPQDESEKDEQERDAHSMHSDSFEEDNQHYTATQTAFEMVPVKTMKEKTRDAAARAFLARETFLHQMQTGPQAPPRPSPVSIASRTLAKAVGDLNNFEPEDWALLTAQSQEWFNTKMKPAIKELKRSRRTTEWDSTTKGSNPQNSLYIRASNLAVPHGEAALKLLTQAGLHPACEHNQRFERTQHPNKPITLTASMQLHLPITDALKSLFVGDTDIQGSLGPIRLEIVSEQESHQMRLTPKSHRDRKAMSHLVPIYTALGASEEDILLLVQLQTEQALSDLWQIHSTSIHPYNNPCTLRQMWGTATKMPRGELLLTGPRAPIPEATSNTLAALAEVAGQELLRAAEGLLTAVAPPRIPKGMPEEISLSLGLITAEHLEEWLLVHNEQNTRLGALLVNAITAAPNWLSQVRAHAKLTPVIGHSTWVENSSIAIHFAQTMTTIVPPILDRTLTRQSVLCILNTIIATALPELAPFEIKDINYFAYQKQTDTPTQRKNHRKGVEGLITLERRPNTPLTMDILAGTMLALHIGNGITAGPGKGMKWCPIAQEWGTTVCGITNITAAYTAPGHTRQQIFLGRKVKGDRVWKIDGHRNSFLRSLIRLLTGTQGDPTTSLAIISKLRSRKFRPVGGIPHPEPRPRPIPPTPPTSPRRTSLAQGPIASLALDNPFQKTIEEAIKHGQAEKILQDLRARNEHTLADQGEILLNPQHLWGQYLNPLEDTKCRDWIKTIPPPCESPVLPAPSVTSQNLGPLGHHLSLPQIQATLALGLPVACFQDLDCSNAEAFSLRKEAVRGTNYKAFTNTRTRTIAPKGDTRTWGGSRRQAALTCLNEDYFDLTKTKQRNWTREDNTRQEAGQGRILWIEAATKTGHHIHIINVYQHTADRPESQRALLGIVERILLRCGDYPKIIIGDINASIAGGRQNYSTGNTGTEQADALLAEFLDRTQGDLMSTTGHTWRDPHSERAAKLDMAILYKVSRSADQGEAQWTGAQGHDHARIAMAIGQELWGPSGSNQERDLHVPRKPKIRQKDLLPYVEKLQAELAPITADILQRIASKTITAKEGKEEMCHNRIAATDKLFPQGGGEDRKGIRAPHNDPTQRAAHGEIRILKRAMQASLRTPQPSATISAMSLLRITEELQLTPQDIALHAQGPEWKAALTARIDWKEKEIEEITCRQKGKIKHQERIRDRKRIETEFKARKNFSIEYTPAQTNILYHPAANGLLWVSSHGAESHSPSHNLEALQARWPQATISTTNATQTAHLTLWAKNTDVAVELLAGIAPSHKPTSPQDGLRSTHSFSWTRTHSTAVLELKALALTLSEAFHRGQLLHNTGTSATNDLINWTTEITEPREIRVLSILLPDLTDTAELLELSSTWDTTSLVERNLLITAGPWKRTNKTIAWETFLEREGLPTHTCCPTKNCRNKDPIIISQGRVKRWDDHPKSIKAVLDPYPEEPLDTTSHHSARTLKTFCQKCWDVTDFRHNVKHVEDMAFMHEAGVFTEKITTQGKRLRGKINESAFKKCIDTYLKTAVAPGQDTLQNEHIKAMSDEEKEILRGWVNTILDPENPTEMTEEETRGMISLLHKGGATSDKTSDLRPIILLNSTHQLVSHIINERLTDVIERDNLLGIEQGGFRRDNSTDRNACKLLAITEEAQRTKARFLRADIDFRNAFNSMSQASLWALMKAFDIPDVDLLESLYKHTSIYLPTPEGPGAQIKLNTGVAQGSVLSPMLFLIFITAASRLLKATGQAKGISHGLPQIDPFNHLAYADDFSIFAQTDAKMQHLMDTIARFQNWSGIKVNMKKTSIMAVDGDKQRRKNPIQVTYNGNQVRTTKEGETVRYLGFYATPNGNMQDSVNRVFQKTKEATEIIEGHHLEHEEALQIFISKAIGTFRFLSPLIPWTEANLNKLSQKWTQAYKTAWRLPLSTASLPFVGPTDEGLLQNPTPIPILGQTLHAHIARCTKQDDTTCAILRLALARAKQTWLCLSWTELIQEAEAREWDDTLDNIWLRLAACDKYTGMETSFHNIEDQNLQGLGWAAATRPLRLLRKQLESALGKKARQHRRVLDIPDDTWDLLWDGERALKEAGPHLWRANHKTIRLTKRRTPLQIPQALLPTNGKATQQWQANIPTIKALSARTRATLQAYLELVDWPTETHTAPQKQTIPWSWANDPKTASPSLPPLTQQQLDNIAAHMNKTDKKHLLSRLAQVKGTEHLAQITTEMSKRMWTMKKTHSMEEDSPIWKLFPGTAALWEALQTHFNLPHTPKQSRGPSGWMDEFNNATNICWKCQCRKTAVCKGNLCQTPRCLECEKTCSVCNVTPDHQPDSKRKCPQDAPASVSSHTMGTQLYEKTEKARFTTPTHMSGKNNVRQQLLQTLFTPDDEGAYFRRKPNPDKEQEATTDDDNVESADEGSSEGPTSPQHPSQNLLNPLPRSTAEGGHLEFRMQVRGWQDRAHVARAIHLLTLPDSALLKTMEHSTFPVLIPQHLFPQNLLSHQEYGWWYIPTAEIEYRTCPTCKKRTPKAHFHTRGEDPQAKCTSCPKSQRAHHARHSESSKKRAQYRQVEQGQRDALDRKSYKLNERVQALWQGGRELWNGTITAISDTRTKTYTITYDDEEVEEGVSFDLIRPAPAESTQDPNTQKGLALRTTDPRSPADGDVILTPMELRSLLAYQQHLPDQKVWATTAEAGFPLEEEEEEIQNERDEWEGKKTARFLHPAISDMAQLLNGIENQGRNLTKTQRAVIQLDNDWMNPANDPHAVTWRRKWEKNPPPPRAKDPPRIQDHLEQSLKLGSTFHLDHPCPNTTEHGIIHIEVESKLWIDNYEGTKIFTKAGLSTSTDLAHSFTILCGTWAHLQARTAPGRRPQLTQEIAEACRIQEELESTDHRTPTRHVLRALKKCTKANRIHGLTSVAAPGFFKNASRGPSALWGEKNVNDIAVYVWDSMDNTDRENSLQDIQEAKTGIIWKERDDAWSGRLLAAGLTKIPIITNKKIRAQGIREKGWWRTGELKTSMTPANHKLECWIPTPLPPHTKSALINALQQALQAPSNTDNKDECILDLIGPEKDYWNGTEAGRLKAYNFPGTCAAGDGSNHEKTKTMGAGFCTLKELHWGRRDLRDRAKILRHNARYCAGVGRGNEGASSNRAEHAALLLCLRKTHRTQDLLYLTDSESLLKTISKWIGEGTRANLATTPDGDIVREIVQILQERVAAGANTFLIKIKAHRGEPLNEAADSRAEQGRTAHDAEDTNEHTPQLLWDHPSGKTIFAWKKNKNSTDDQDPERKTRTWGNATRTEMRAAGARKEMEKAINTSTKKWIKINFPKGKPPTSEGLRAFQDHTWKDKKRWLEYILKNHQDTHPLPTTSYSPIVPATSTKTTDFFMREPSCRQAISKYLKSSSERTEDKRRLIQIITNSFPANAFTSKFKKGKSNRCDICRRALQATGATTTEEDLPIQTVGHITGYCLGQTDAITAAHHSTWKTLHSGIAQAAPKGWEFPSEKGELTIGHLWADNKMDEICTKDNLWETARTSEIQRTLTAADEEICKAAKNPKAMRETKAMERFFRTRPDGIAHHNENKIWYLMEFKRTSDILPDYLERKDKMAFKQYENFLNILRKAKKPGWTTDQLNFIVGSKTINENAMDTNLEKIGINQKKKKKIKAATAKANIHGLLNILKAYYANTHQDPPKPELNEGTEGLKLTIDTRQALGMRPPYTNQNGTKTLPAKGKRTKRQDYEGVYTSLIPQVNYIEGPAHNSLPSSVRTLLQAPSRASPKRPILNHTGPPPCPTTTGLRSPKKARTDAPKPLDYTPQTYASSDPPAYNGAPHTRKRPPEDNPQGFSGKQKKKKKKRLTPPETGSDTLSEHLFAYLG